MIRTSSEVGLQSSEDMIRAEIEQRVPEHQLQYVPVDWLLDFPELVDGRPVVLPDEKVAVVDWPAYTAAMMDPELAPIAATVVDRYQGVHLELAQQYGYSRALNTAGDELGEEGQASGDGETVEADLTTIRFGLESQICFMDILEDYPDLSSFIERNKGRRPALIHFAVSSPRSISESLLVGMARLGIDRFGFFNAGKILDAKHLASTGWVTSSTGRLRVGGRTGEQEEWGKNGPDVILSRNIEEETKRVLQNVGLAVRTGPRNARGQVEYVTVEVPPGGDIRAIHQQLSVEVSKPVVSPRKPRMDFPRRFVDKIVSLSHQMKPASEQESLARGMSPFYQRGQEGKPRPSHVSEGVNRGADGFFSYTHWDRFHEKLMARSEQLFPSQDASQEHREMAVMHMIGVAIAHTAEAIAMPYDRAGIQAKEVELTTNFDIYHVLTGNTEAPYDDPQRARRAAMKAVAESMSVLESKNFRTSFTARIEAAAEERNLQIDRYVLRELIEDTPFHCDVGAAFGRDFLIDEPVKRASPHAHRIAGIRGDVLPRVSRIGGFKGKDVYRSRISELEGQAKVNGSLSPDRQQELATLKRMKELGDDNCIIMERRDAERVGINPERIHHIDLPRTRLKGISEPVDLVAFFPNIPLQKR